MKFCHKKNISLQALGGVNGNTISDEVINALVDYGVKEIAFSIDGASQDVYSIYRRGGNLDTVINNIKKINARKAEQGSEFPKLTWKYVIFGHNVCEMKKARKMAKELNMDFSYADNWFVGYSPIAKKDLAFVEREKRSPSLLDPNILLNTLFSKTLSLCYSRNVSDQVSDCFVSRGSISPMSIS